MGLHMKKSFEIGNKVCIKRKFSNDDVQNFAILTEDFNPIHLDDEFAKSTIFKKRIVHGMLISSLFSNLIGTKLPGKGSIYLSQSLSFKAPLFINEEFIAEIEIIKIRTDKPIITLKTVGYNAKNKIIIEGEAVVKYDEIKKI